MSSVLRLSIIAVMLFATAALGLIGYSMTLPKVEPISVQAAPAPPTPPTPVYFVAKYPLTEGTLVRDEYFHSEPLAEAPSGAFRNTPGDMSKLRGSLVQKFIYAGNAITSQDVMLRDDKGFLAALGKVCQAANTREKTTVTVYVGAKTTEYSVKKTDLKASAACAELDAATLTSPRPTL